MKKLKESTKIIIGMIIGLILSTASYVVAENLIDSKDVVYEDNSNLAAHNVQSAIDGTCTKIDKRLSDIEDKLYTVKSFNVSKRITPNSTATSTPLSYTDIYVTLPANSYCSITGKASYGSHIPYRVSLNSSSTNVIETLSYSDYDLSMEGASETSTTYSIYTENSITVYLWVKYTYNASPVTITEVVGINGFCATKYK